MVSFSLHKPDSRRVSTNSQGKKPACGALRPNLNYRLVKNAGDINISFLSEVYKMCNNNYQYQLILKELDVFHFNTSKLFIKHEAIIH